MPEPDSENQKDSPAEKMPTEARQSNTLTNQSYRKTPWLLLALPLVMIGVILFVSPNFQLSDSLRNDPLGSDFLQEWVGASICNSAEQNRLYDPVHFKAMQHDADLVGFEWQEKNFFPMVYPPFYYLALQPFTIVSYPVAMRIWAVLSALAFSLTGFLLFRFYAPCRRLLGIWLIASLVFVPLLTCFNMGQKASFLLLILTATFVLLHNKRPLSAGIVFGLIVFKPHLGIVIGLAMLVKGQWRFALGAVGMVAAIAGGSFLLYPILWADYLRTVSGMTDYVQSGGYLLHDSHSLWGASQLSLSAWLPANAIKALTGILSLGVAALALASLRGKIETASSDFARQFSVLVLAMILLSPHFYTYDLTIILLPLLLIATTFVPGQWKSNPTEKAIAVLLGSLFVFAGMFSNVANTIRIQPSIFVIVAVIVLITKAREKDASLEAS